MDDSNIFERHDLILDLTPIEPTITDFNYYCHDFTSCTKTGLTIDEVVKYFENDLSVIVIDPYEKKLYRAGKPIEVVANTKNSKTIEFKALE